MGRLDANENARFPRRHKTEAVVNGDAVVRMFRAHRFDDGIQLLIAHGTVGGVIDSGDEAAIFAVREVLDELADDTPIMISVTFPDVSGRVQLMNVPLPGQANIAINKVLAGYFAGLKAGTSGSLFLDEFVFTR